MNEDVAASYLLHMETKTIKPSEMGTTGLVDYVLAGQNQIIPVQHRHCRGGRCMYRVRLAVAVRVIRNRYPSRADETERLFRDAVNATASARWERKMRETNWGKVA